MDDPPVATTQPLGGGTLSPQTGVPSTLPMTPRMEGAPMQRTLSSPAPAGAPSPAQGAVGNSTLASALPMPDPAAITRGEARADVSGDTQLSFNDPSAHIAYDAVPAPPRSKTIPVIAGAAAVIVATLGIAFAATRGKHTTADSPPRDVPSAEASASASVAAAASVKATGTASAAAPVAASATVTIAPSAAASAIVGRRPGTRSGSGTGTGTGAMTVVPPGSSGPKKPPPNPYANE